MSGFKPRGQGHGIDAADPCFPQKSHRFNEHPAGSASDQTDAGASADSGVARAVVTEAHSVTPSGEVKAPTVFDVTKKGEAGMVVNGFLWEAEESFRKVPDGTKGTLVFTEAALSDHIRRVDGPKGFHVAGSLNAQWAQEKLTPVDLTELREAWKNWAPGAGWLDGFNELLAAVERLVGK